MEVFRSQQWSRDVCFSSFWAHFNAVEKWKADHARMAFVACGLTCGKEKHYERGSDFTYKHIRRPKRERMKSCRKNAQVESNCEHNAEQDEMDTSSAADNEEMSEEMVEFFKKTIEHRKNRDAKRAGAEQHNADQSDSTTHWIQLHDNEYISADKIGVHGVQRRTFAGPDEAERNRLRRENARLLYGSNAERILAMETLIDMRFEQEYAKKRPPLWPNIPLKF